ncbi:DUF3427 domain-containing protein [Flindersiella endophytica]
MGELAPGIYQHLVTHGLEGRLADIEPELLQLENLESATAPDVLARHLAALARRALRSASSDDVAVQIEMANRIADAIAATAADAVDRDDLVAAASELMAVSRCRTPDGKPSFPLRPEIPLSASALLVNGRGQPEIGHEIKRELASTGKVDLLCAFVKWNGVRILAPAIEEFRQRGGELRVVTTTYIGATDQSALNKLAELGARIKVSYDVHMTRLHAKAWLFRRENGLSTAYVGSSNLSRTALSHGLEWNVRLAEAEQPHLIETFAATFDDYWNDSEYEDYDPHDREQADRLGSALAEARGERTGATVIDLAPIEVRPRTYQSEILDELDAERTVHGYWHNLVVMATGTGKTVVAGLDYRRLREEGRVDSLLFVAHQNELLTQSLLTFRQILRDHAFGELYVGGRRPEDWKHVFASVQSLHRLDLANLDPRRYDMVIVDEFHHAEAPTYRRLLDHLRPHVLVGLTATPERSDGLDIRSWFDGRTAVELRLWEALERNLLSPFQYFGIHDGTDLSGIGFKRGQGYEVGELTNLYTGNDTRVAVVLQAVRDKIDDPGRMRALGFCVSIEHALFMAERFDRAGIPSRALTSRSSAEERDQTLRDLRERRINAVFAVDLFNEGVDIPEIDTALFLRPTDSATVFLQQLGRGLRRTSDKPCLTVLDFVGMQHKQFRFDRRYRALSGVSRTRLAKEIEDGFPTLPPGCHIQLDRELGRMVLRNVRQALELRWRDLAAELRSYGDPSLPEFLAETGLELEDLYRRGRAGWTGLRRTAGLDDDPADETDRKLGSAIGRMLHIDDPSRLEDLARLPETPRAGVLNMLDVALWGGSDRKSEAEERLRKLIDEHPRRCEELQVVADLLRAKIRRVTPAVGLLCLHARYSKNEALAAFGVDRPAHVREGVKWVADARADLFFVTIDKAEEHYSPTTMYHDRAITPELFQWESQSVRRPHHRDPQRYIHHEELGSTVHLFVRQSNRDEGWGAPPYLYAGPMTYVSHQGSRPIRFHWRLRHALPADVYHYAKATVG